MYIPNQYSVKERSEIYFTIMKENASMRYVGRRYRNQ